MGWAVPLADSQCRKVAPFKIFVVGSDQYEKIQNAPEIVSKEDQQSHKHLKESESLNENGYSGFNLALLNKYFF